MIRSPFRNFYKQFAQIALIICLVFTIACQSEAEKQAQMLAADTTANAQLRQINAAISANHTVTPEQFETLKNLREKYPQSGEVRQAYKNALVVREDWAALEKLLNETPTEELSRDDKIMLAKVYLKLGRYQSVIETLLPLYEETPGSVEISSYLAGAYFYLGRYDEAEKPLERVWQQILNQKMTDDVILRGMIYLHRGEYEKAVEYLEKALEFNPESIPANNALSRVYAARGDIEKAEQYNAKVQQAFDKITAEEQKRTRAVSKVYQLQEAFQAKRYEEVITIARNLLPESDAGSKVTLYQYIANSYEALGKKQEAQNALAEAQKLQNK